MPRDHHWLGLEVKGEIEQHHDQYKVEPAPKQEELSSVQMPLLAGEAVKEAAHESLKEHGSGR